MKDFYKIAGLFRKFRTHTIREGEILELREWLKEGENRELFHRLMDGKRESEVMRELKKYDREAAFRRFSNRVHPGKRWIGYYARWAAVVALPILFGVLIYRWMNVPEQKNTPRVEIATLAPGQRVAVLTLDNGSCVALSDTVTREIALGGGEKIMVDSTGLQYHRIQPEETVKTNTLYVPRRGEYSLTLSDGTRVFLNSDSKLVYPVSFGKGKREVTLEGEAYFDVTKDTERPFVVKTRDLSVLVLGTAFNLKNYPGDLNVETTLERGCVKVEEGDREILLEPGEQARFNRNSGEMDKVRVNTALYTSWKQGLFIFERERLEDILTILARWYDVDIFYQRSSVKEDLFTGDLKKYENIDELLKMLEMTTDVRFEIRGNTIIVK